MRCDGFPKFRHVSLKQVEMEAVSGSKDKTVKIWDTSSGAAGVKSTQLNAAFRNSGVVVHRCRRRTKPAKP